MIFITVVLQDHDRCSESVSAFPSDLIVIVPGAAVVVKCQQAVFIPSAVVRTCLHDYPALVIQEFIAVRHYDPALDVAQIVHPGPAVAHQADADFLFGPVCEHHSPAVLGRFHEFKYIGSVIAGFRSLIARNDGGQAVEILSCGRHIVRKVRKVRTVLIASLTVVAVYCPDETALLFLFFRIGIQVSVHREDNLLAHSLQNLGNRLSVLLSMFQHNLFGLLSGNSFHRFNLRQFRLHAAGQPQHFSVGVRNNLDGSAGNCCIRIHLAEHIVMVAGRIRDSAPGFELNPFVSAQKTGQGRKHSLCVPHILHRTRAAASFHKKDSAVTRMYDSPVSVQKLDRLRRELCGRKIFLFRGRFLIRFRKAFCCCRLFQGFSRVRRGGGSQHSCCQQCTEFLLHFHFLPFPFFFPSPLSAGSDPAPGSQEDPLPSPPLILYVSFF